MRNLTFCVAILVMFTAGLSVAQQSAPVKFEGGLLRGISEGGLAVYTGIPYAAPPVGELRWRPPRPPVPWEGVRRRRNFPLTLCS